MRPTSRWSLLSPQEDGYGKRHNYPHYAGPHWHRSSADYHLNLEDESQQMGERDYCKHDHGGENCWLHGS